VPALVVSGGPMLNGCYRGQRIGFRDRRIWQMSEAMRAGKIGMAEFIEAESCMNRSRGHCMYDGDRFDNGIHSRITRYGLAA